jgi:hypothetical protein
MRTVKKAIYPYIITVLTLMPYTNFTSRLVDRMLTEIES